MAAHIAGDDGGGTGAPPRRKILVALDESDNSMHALSWAIHHLILPPQQSQTESAAPDTSSAAPDTSHLLIVLLHVHAHAQVSVGPASAYLRPEAMAALKKHQEDISKKLLLRAKTLCNEKHLDSEIMVVAGDPRDCICQAVEKLHADYLVMGSHGYGAFKRILVGSVSEYCAYNAKCSVVIVKKP